MQLASPPPEQLDGSVRIVELIGKVVGPSAVGIDGAKMGAYFPRKPTMGHRKILVVAFG
jgi:hypothetical protein